MKQIRMELLEGSLTNLNIEAYFKLIQATQDQHGLLEASYLPQKSVWKMERTKFLNYKSRYLGMFI